MLPFITQQQQHMDTGSFLLTLAGSCLLRRKHGPRECSPQLSHTGPGPVSHSNSTRIQRGSPDKLHRTAGATAGSSIFNLLPGKKARFHTVALCVHIRTYTYTYPGRHHRHQWHCTYARPPGVHGSQPVSQWQPLAFEASPPRACQRIQWRETGTS